MTKDVNELEMKIAFLEDAMEKLSDEFYQQQQEIDVLKRQQGVLVERLKDMSGSEGDSNSFATDEKPPHY